MRRIVSGRAGPSHHDRASPTPPGDPFRRRLHAMFCLGLLCHSARRPGRLSPRPPSIRRGPATPGALPHPAGPTGKHRRHRRRRPPHTFRCRPAHPVTPRVSLAHLRRAVHRPPSAPGLRLPPAGPQPLPPVRPARPVPQRNQKSYLSDWTTSRYACSRDTRWTLTADTSMSRRASTTSLSDTCWGSKQPILPA